MDNDCNGIIDNDPTDGTTWYADADEDGFGGASFSVTACDQPNGTVDNADDCDDLQASVYPGAEEVCDGVDQDCDAEIDEDATDPATWYADADGDGYGDANSAAEACDAPSDHVDNADDCDDTNPDLSPDTVWYADIDGDGHGAENFTTTGCEQPSGYTGEASDCDDLDATVNPLADEFCDEIDNNCDGTTDEDTALDATTWYTDGDADGFGDETTARVACTAGSGEVDVADDCDDAEATTYPGAVEVCDDGIDQDCSGRADNTCQEEVSLGEAIALVEGEYSNDYAGRALGVGDFNGDGTDDLLVGASSHDYGATGSYAGGRGEGFVIYGPFSGEAVDASTADARFKGTTSSDSLGYTVSSLGDQDGDGADEVLLGAYGEDTAANSGGSAYVFYGGTTGTFDASSADAQVSGTSSYAYLGYYTLEGEGDINGDGTADGTADVVVGAYGEGSFQGAVYTFFGPLSGSLTTASADVTVTGTGTGDYVGYGAVGDKDFNGDGSGDLGVGVPGSDIAGVWYGPLSSGTSVSGTSGADWTGAGVASGDFYGSMMGGGDYDNDGYDDLLVGAKYDDSGSSSGGAVYIYYGSASGIDQTAGYTLVGTNSSDFLGHNTDGVEAADVDGDGNQDLVLGYNYNDDGGGSGSGTVHIVYGPMLGTYTTANTDRYLDGSATSDYLGRGIAVMDDDGDGQDDVWMGAYGTTYGSAYLIPGTSLD